MNNFIELSDQEICSVSGGIMETVIYGTLIVGSAFVGMAAHTIFVFAIGADPSLHSTKIDCAERVHGKYADRCISAWGVSVGFSSCEECYGKFASLEPDGMTALLNNNDTIQNVCTG